MMTLNLLIIITSAIWILSEMVLLVTKRSRTRRVESADKGSQRILWLTISLSVASGILAAVYRAASLPGNARIWAMIGMLLMLAGLAIRWTAIFTLNELFTIDVAIAESQHVVEHGIYRYVRHPSYTGLLTSFLGLGIAFADGLSILLIVVPTALAVLHRVRIEEAALHKALGGQYTRYARRTRRFLPFLFLQ